MKARLNAKTILACAGAAGCMLAAITHPLAFAVAAAGGVCIIMLALSAICIF